MIPRSSRPGGILPADGLRRARLRLDFRPSLSATLETIKQRLRASLLSARLPEEKISRRATEITGNLQPDGSWPDLAGLDSFAGNADGTPAHLQRTLLLAQANRGAGGPLGKPLRQALDFWLAHDFQAADWQQNQVVVPRLIGSIALLVDDGLSPGARGKVTEILARSRWQHWVEGSGWVDWTGTASCCAPRTTCCCAAASAGWTTSLKNLSRACSARSASPRRERKASSRT